MSREIRFRVWDKESEKMVYREREDYDAVELLQFTGLKDNNEVEIYEGDVIGKESCQNHYVSFESGMFVGISTNKIQAINIRPWKLKRMIDSGYAKIGNIYENKNLLEEK